MSYLKVAVLGQTSGGEVWSTSMAFRFYGIFSGSMGQQLLDSAATRIMTAVTSSTLGSNLRAMMSSSLSITGWRISQHDENEKTTAVGQANYAAPIAGINPPTKTPQDAIVISLRTATPGARGRGRMYWPACGATLGTTFKLTSPSSTQIATEMRALIRLIGDQINQELGANSLTVTVELAVRSITGHTSYQVNQMRVGDVLDTQRRRRDKIIESYTSLGYPT